MLLKFFFIFIKDPEPDLDIYVESGAGSGQKSSGSATLTVSQQGFEVFFYVEARGFEDYSRRFFILKKSYQLYGVLDTAESKYLCSGIESIDTSGLQPHSLTHSLQYQGRRLNGGGNTLYSYLPSFIPKD